MAELLERKKKIAALKRDVEDAATPELSDDEVSFISLFLISPDFIHSFSLS